MNRIGCSESDNGFGPNKEVLLVDVNNNNNDDGHDDDDRLSLTPQPSGRDLHSNSRCNGTTMKRQAPVSGWWSQDCRRLLLDFLSPSLCMLELSAASRASR